MPLVRRRGLSALNCRAAEAYEPPEQSVCENYCLTTLVHGPDLPCKGCSQLVHAALL